MSPLRIFAHDVDPNLFPIGSAISLGSIPWPNVPKVRELAEFHAAPPEAARTGGDGLPMVALLLDRKNAQAAIEKVRAAEPFGVNVIEYEGAPYFVLVCEQKSFGLLHTDQDRWASQLFLDRRRASDGGHALLITGKAGSKDQQTVFGFFELTSATRPRFVPTIRPQRGRVVRAAVLAGAAR